MKKLPPNIVEVEPVNKCDVCNEKPAKYYSTVWYIHICSLACLKKFLKGYSKEIDDIALEMKGANDLGEDKDAV